MAKIIPLCSSSKGNSILVSLGKTNILIDLGCSYLELNTYLKDFGFDINDISAVFVTHEHSDHAKGLATFSKRTGIPIYASNGTIKGLFERKLLKPGSKIFSLDDIKDLELDIKYFKTSHDANDSVGYVFKNNEYSFAYCTDLGEVTDTVRKSLYGIDVVFLESNYNLKMLNNNINYPYFLKSRINSCTGHLSNEQSADFSVDLIKNGTRHIILGHLSQENNTHRLAYECNCKTLAINGITTGVDYLLNIAGVVHNGETIAI